MRARVGAVYGHPCARKSRKNQSIIFHARARFADYYAARARGEKENAQLHGARARIYCYYTFLTQYSLEVYIVSSGFSFRALPQHDTQT